MKTYYETLEVSTEASQEVIAAAYRSLSKKYHPDLNPNSPDAEEKMKLINLAYETLSEPSKRNEYNKSLNRTALESFGVPQKNSEELVKIETNMGLGLFLFILVVLIALLFFFSATHSNDATEAAPRYSSDQTPLSDYEKAHQIDEEKFLNADQLIKGDSIPKNYQLALKEYETLQGHFADGRVERRIAEIYYNGYGVEKNYTQASSLFKKANDAYSRNKPTIEDSAYKNGYLDEFSLLMLAGIYEKGLGIRKSKIKAYYYYNVVAGSIDKTKLGQYNESAIASLAGVKWFAPFDLEMISRDSLGFVDYQAFAISKREDLSNKLTPSEINYAQNLSE